MYSTFNIVSVLNLFSYPICIMLLGLWGLLVLRRNLILILICIELLLLSLNLLFIFFSIVVDDITGQVFSLYILTVAGAESAIGLAFVGCFL